MEAVAPGGGRRGSWWQAVCRGPQAATNYVTGPKLLSRGGTLVTTSAKTGTRGVWTSLQNWWGIEESPLGEHSPLESGPWQVVASALVSWTLQVLDAQRHAKPEFFGMKRVNSFIGGHMGKYSVRMYKSG